ncbi:MAG: MerR family transcriptional regulator [Lachnospiraceae bacterium]|nr:MerR family transcriptional regulator [Lachnospiraceae bacterium]
METYMIKDAAKELNVEAHVLRYWEEELGLAIKRNSMGHRYYDEKDIKIFKNVQELKKRGLSLKDIRDGIEKAKKEQSLSDGTDSNTGNDTDKNSKVVAIHRDSIDDENNGKDNKPEAEIFEFNRNSNDDADIKTHEKGAEVKIVDFKMAQFQNIMNKVIANALRENKDIITDSIKSEVTVDVMKQFDAVMREKEEKEERRYKKLDECLREIQKANMEAAATRDRGFFRRKKAKNR